MQRGPRQWLRRLTLAAIVAAAVSQKPQTHMLSQDCFAIEYGWSYLGLSAGEAVPVDLPSARVWSSTQPYTVSAVPFASERRISYTKDVVAYVDLRAGESDHTTIRVARVGNLGPVFFPKSEYHYETSLKGADAFFAWNSEPQWKWYLRMTDDGTAEPTKSVRNASQVATDGETVVWTDVAIDGNRTIRAMSARATVGHFQRRALPWDSSCNPAGGVERLQPSVCGRKITYTEVSSGRSRVLQYDLQTSTVNEHSPDSSVSRFSPVSWDMTPQGDRSCVVAVVEVAGGAAVAGGIAEVDSAFTQLSGTGAADAPSFPAVLPSGGIATLEAATVTVELPSRRRVSVTKAMRDAAGLTATPFLWGITGGGDKLFLLLAGVGGRRSLATVDLTVADANLAVQARWSSTSPASLHSALPDAAIVATSAGLHLFRLPTPLALSKGLPPEAAAFNCTLTPANVASRSKQLSLVAGHVDQLAYAVAGASPADAHLKLGDLDKDNDGLADRQDRFPLQTEFTWDHDNDGVADEADLVTVSGSCNDDILFSPGSCIGDIVIMYSVWGFCTMLLLVGAMVLGSVRWEHIRENEAREEQALQRENSFDTRVPMADDNDDELNRFDEEDELDDRASNAVVVWGRVEMAVEMFLVLLTVFSVALVFVPMWNLDPLPARVESIFAWIDVYAMSCFLVDLIFRWYYREDQEESLFEFLKRNWYDIPSLWCDPPGIAESGTGLDLLVVTRLLRIMRLLRIFRMLRLYRRLTGSLGNTAAFVGIILKYTQWLVPVIVLLLVIIMSIFLKITEQAGQPDTFSSYWDCIWFSVVTVTTVGYGDRSPVNWFGRVLSCIMMICGIGMIGNVTARVSEGIQASGHRTAKRQERQGAESLWDSHALRSVLRELSVSFNPLLTVKDGQRTLMDMRSRQILQRFGSARYPDPFLDRERHHAPGAGGVARRESDAWGDDDDDRSSCVPTGAADGLSALSERGSQSEESDIDSICPRVRSASSGVHHQIVLRDAFQRIARDVWSGSGLAGDDTEWSVPAPALGFGMQQDAGVQDMLTRLEPDERPPFDRVFQRLTHPRERHREVTLPELVLELETQRGILNTARRARRGSRAEHRLDSELGDPYERSEAQKLIDRLRTFQQDRTEGVDGEITVQAPKKPGGLGATLGVTLEGCVVVKVMADGAARKKNVRELCVVKEINGERVTQAEDIKAVMSKTQPGAAVSVQVSDRPVPLCRDSLFFLFLQHKIDEDWKPIEDWTGLYQRLCALIFRAPERNGLVVEKMFAIGAFESMKGEEEAADPGEQESTYDWQDPVEDLFAEAEHIMYQHGIGNLESPQEILRAVQNQIFRFDRVECLRWLLHHMQWKQPTCGDDDIVFVPRPPLRTDVKDQMPELDDRVHVPGTALCADCERPLVWVPPIGEVTLRLRGPAPTCPAGLSAARAAAVGATDLAVLLVEAADVPADMLLEVLTATPGSCIPGSCDCFALLRIQQSAAYPHFSIRTAVKEVLAAAERAPEGDGILDATSGNKTLQAGTSYRLGELVQVRDNAAGEWRGARVQTISDGEVHAVTLEEEPDGPRQWEHVLPMQPSQVECQGTLCEERRDRRRRISEWPGMMATLGSLGLGTVDLTQDYRGHLKCEECGVALCASCAAVNGADAEHDHDRSLRSKSSAGSMSRHGQFGSGNRPKLPSQLRRQSDLSMGRFSSRGSSGGGSAGRKDSELFGTPQLRAARYVVRDLPPMGSSARSDEGPAL